MLHKKLHEKLLVSEIVLILASVFIFRSMWHLLDKVPFFNNTAVLITTLVLGFLVAIPTWRYVINRHH
ncbi:MAG: hypothetical protein WD963_01610 [Candidatus Paceibacterota bacterium]